MFLDLTRDELKTIIRDHGNLGCKLNASTDKMREVVVKAHNEGYQHTLLTKVNPTQSVSEARARSAGNEQLDARSEAVEPVESDLFDKVQSLVEKTTYSRLYGSTQGLNKATSLDLFEMVRDQSEVILLGEVTDDKGGRNGGLVHYSLNDHEMKRLDYFSDMNLLSPLGVDQQAPIKDTRVLNLVSSILEHGLLQPIELVTIEETNVTFIGGGRHRLHALNIICDVIHNHGLDVPIIRRTVKNTTDALLLIEASNGSRSMTQVEKQTIKTQVRYGVDPHSVDDLCAAVEASQMKPEVALPLAVIASLPTDWSTLTHQTIASIAKAVWKEYRRQLRLKVRLVEIDFASFVDQLTQRLMCIEYEGNTAREYGKYIHTILVALV